MKKSRVVLLIGLTGLLSSCSIYSLLSNNSGGFNPGSGSNGITISKDPLQKKAIDVYDAKRFVEEKPSSKSIAPYKVGQLDVYYPQGKEDVLYVTFDAYCNHLTRYFTAGCSATISGNSAAPTWNVKRGNSLVYQVKMDLSAATFTSGGSLYSIDDLSPSYGLSSLNLGGSSTNEVVNQGNTYKTHSFGDFKTTFYVDSANNYYIPLGLLEAEIGKEYGSWHFHDFSRLYRYDSHDQLSAEFQLDGKTMNAETGIRDYMSSHSSMPEGLRRLDADVIYYVFENQYGLLAQRGFSSGKAALDTRNTYERLLSADTLSRQKALYEAFAIFDDDHTGVYADHGEMWGETREGYVRGARSVARTLVRQDLTEKRTAWLEKLGKTTMDVLYQGDMAYFSFDSFSFAKEAYKEDHETLREDLYKEDSFFYFLHQFDDINAHGGIKNVVIDLSLNGGGVVGIMGKLLALISPKNSNRLGVQNIDTNLLYVTITRVDVNNDLRYDDNETYGGKYDFYLLTGDMSFSCGNAFPFLARKQAFAKTIGVNSGGGECTVDSSFLPSGHGIVFSSMNHLGSVLKGTSTLYGTEGGAGVDIPLSYDYFYDLPSLYQAIHK